MQKLALALLCTSSVALADDPPIEIHDLAPQGEVILTSAVAVSERSVAKGWLILPEGYELTGELRMLTADGFAGRPLALTDVALETTRARVALGHRIELFGAVDVLPKQPSYTSEHLWQGATVGVNTQPWARSLALGLHASGGPMLDSLGTWGQLGLGATAHKVVHQIVTFEGGASLLETQLWPRADVRAARLTEAAIHGALLFKDPEGWTGGWFGFDYALPLAHRGDDPVSAMPLAPQPRLDLGIGVVLSFVEHWDIFGKLAIIDRGDLAMPATRLPILDGGFDQHQLVLGLTYHAKERSRD